MRWLIFKTNQAHSENLPPTYAAFYYGFLRSHYQCLIWNNDCVSNPTIPSPLEHGCELDEDKYVEIMSNLPPAPDSILNLIQCGCDKSKCGGVRCTCRGVRLNCTELCGCSLNVSAKINLNKKMNKLTMKVTNMRVKTKFSERRDTKIMRFKFLYEEIHPCYQIFTSVKTLK